MCDAHDKKWTKTNNGRNRIAKSRKIRMFEEKENYQYMGIFEADIIKQADMKEYIIKEYTGQTRKVLETNQKSHQRNKHLGGPPCKILGTILRTQTKGPEDKKVNDDAQIFTSER